MTIWDVLASRNAHLTRATPAEANEMFVTISAATEKYEFRMRVLMRAIRADILLGIPQKNVVRAIRDGDPDAAFIQNLALDVAIKHAAPAMDIYQGALGDAGDVVAALDRRAPFNRVHDLAINWTRRNATKLIDSTTVQSLAAVRDQLERAVIRGDNPLKAARQIRGLIGVTRPHAKAVDRFYSKLLERGVVERRALDQSTRYATRLIKYRADNIARTEMLRAANAGQHEYWNQLADQGIINRETTRREWVTAEDDRVCEECAPMDGSEVAFDEPFESSVLGAPGEDTRPRPGPFVITTFPPLHPSCRCTVVLV